MPQIYVDLIRHGHSCSNLAQDLAVDLKGRGLHNLAGLYYKFVENDPELSSLGLEMAVGVEHDIRENNPQGLVNPCSDDEGKKCPDYLYSSPLRRAIETAHTMWDTQPIRIAPYLLEHGIGHENVPLHREEQKSRLLARYPDLDNKLIQPTVDSRAPQSRQSPKTPDAYKTTGNLNKFIEWLQDDLGQLSTTNGDIFVSVVTHSILMRGNLGLSEKPNNQSIYRLSWDINTWNTQKGLQIKGRATKLYNGRRVDRKDLARGKEASKHCDWYGKF